MVPRFVARQLSHPSGLLGRGIVRLMNRHNANINAFAVEQLAVSSADRVLEIGFGGGATLPPLLESAAFVAGVDRSAYVVRRATSRFATEIAAGRAAFQQGEVAALPYPDAAFTRVCTVNTVYFWKSLNLAFAEIRRVLAPGGRAVVGLLPKDRMERMGVPTDIFNMRRPDEVIAALHEMGFLNIRPQRPRPTTPWVVIVATR